MVLGWPAHSEKINVHRTLVFLFSFFVKKKKDFYWFSFSILEFWVSVFMLCTYFLFWESFEFFFCVFLNFYFQKTTIPLMGFSVSTPPLPSPPCPSSNSHLASYVSYKSLFPFAAPIGISIDLLWGGLWIFFQMELPFNHFHGNLFYWHANIYTYFPKAEAHWSNSDGLVHNVEVSTSCDTCRFSSAKKVDCP